jgi:hypothetical protein
MSDLRGEESHEGDATVKPSGDEGGAVARKRRSFQWQFDRSATKAQQSPLTPFSRDRSRASCDDARAADGNADAALTLRAGVSTSSGGGPLAASLGLSGPASVSWG